MVNWLLRGLDPVDYLVRSVQGRGRFPPYSIRVRSNGFTRQFGGGTFERYGRILCRHLCDGAGLSSTSRILEIGCGCGRTAFALGERFGSCEYLGVDIEPKSLRGAENNKYLREHGMAFQLLDIQNDEYNPRGSERASDYRFPYSDETRDAIFLVSVFTHMLTPDVRNYVREIGRLLSPGGVCMITAFLIDHGTQGPNVSFPFRDQEHYFQSRAMPEIAVAYSLSFLESQCAQSSMRLCRDPVWGSWRDNPAIRSDSGFGQDILFFEKSPTSRN